MRLASVQWFDGQSVLADVQEATLRGSWYVGLMGAGLEPVFKAANRATAELRALRILNALNSYARKHGRQTSELNDLSLPQPVVIDPFTGQPLILKRTDKGWIVYPLMDDIVDDGGDFKDYRDYGIGPPGHAFDPADWQEEEE